MVSDDATPHPTPQAFTGTLHFRGNFAYLAITPHSSAMLQFDPDLDGRESLDAARQTATQLSYGRNDGDPLSVDGMWLRSVLDPAGNILFWDNLL